ncbi:MAG: apolipoprotein N-acyltransferase, partial [Deltaproteobacteria bacterium]|nr:apolipoprotein N-acyltransferase [Deltaproteobacteria bacterium]
GKYLARVANTGVTAIINPYGRIISETSIFERTYLLGEISLIEGRTVYTRIGDLFAILVTVFVVVSFIVARVILRKRLAR